MQRNYHKLRFALFIRSYPGYVIQEYARNLEIKKPTIKRLTKILLIKENLSRCFLLHKACSRKFNEIIKTDIKDKEKISVYLQIEKELCLLSITKHTKNRYLVEDYERILLSTAVERTAGNNLKAIISDHEFDKKLAELQKLYIKWYYYIVYKYRLPTMRILPYILRLIQMTS